MNRERFLLCDVFFLGTARRTDSQSPASIAGTSKRETAHKGSDSCGTGRRSRARRGTVLVSTRGVVAGERVASGTRNGEDSRRTVIMYT